jgi:microcystin-dependent protein
MDAFMGMIAPFAFNYTPNGWYQCNGQLLAISQNSTLFALLGTQYGGDGQVTFQLPDLRSRTLVGMGQGVGLSLWQLGDINGAEHVALTQANLPPHAHTLPASTGAANRSSPTGNVLAAAVASDGSPVNTYANTSANATLGTQTGNGTGSAVPVSVLSPGLAVNFCICATGIFPTRN